MNVRKERKKKKIFAAMLLALMTVLAAGVAVFADGTDSYALTIVKKIDENGLPEDVLKWAKDQEYTFRIDGFGYAGGEVKSLSELFDSSNPLPEGAKFVDDGNALLVTIKGEGSLDIFFTNAVAATISEVTDGLQYDNGSDIWNMSTAECEANMPTKLVYGTNAGTGSRDLAINIGKDGGKIMVSKPDDAKLVGYFRPRKKEEAAPADNPRQARLSGEALPVKRVGPGENAEWDNLNQGSYIIEKLEGAKGFSVNVGQRKVDVPENGEGTVYINGNYGRLTITAPGVRGGDEQYYYTISGKAEVKDEYGNVRTEKYERVTSPVKAGEQYQVDHLPKGLLTVKECIYSPAPGFTVTGMKVDGRVKTVTTKINKDKLTTWRWVDNLPADMLSNAKVQISQITGPNKGTNVKFGVGGTWNDDPSKEVLWKYPCTVGTPKDITTRYMLPGSKIKLNWNGNADITEVVVKFFYDREVEMESSFEQPDVFYTKTISQDWMEISKAADNTPEGEVYYYYTILDGNNNPITNYSVIKNGAPVSGSEVTDREGTAVRIKSGDTVRLEGLQPGSYQIKETVDADEPAAFQMAVEETESTTSPSDSVNINILGPRTITIKRDVDPPGEELPDLVYTFRVLDNNNNLIKEVILRAGESAEIELPEEGEYTVEELDRSEIFELSYTDSGTVGVMTTTKAWSSRSFLSRAREAEPDKSTVTFTNSFSKEEGAYRVIHEYYYKGRDGAYRCEGTSILTSVGGLSLNDTEYTDEDVITQNIFDSKTYIYFQSAYGTAEPEDSEEAELSDEPVRFSLATGSNIATRSNVKARADSRSSRTGLSRGGIQPYRKVTGSYGAKIEDMASPSDGERLLPDEEETEQTGAGRASRFAPVRKGLAEDEIMPLADDKGIDPEASEFDDDGMISRGVVFSRGKKLAYEPEAGKNYVEATKEGNQVIILRYFRQDPPEGNYKILHVYYLRNEKGDIREGTSEIIDVDPVELTAEARKELHTADLVPRREKPSAYYSQEGSRQDCPYEYTYFGCAYGKVVQGGDPRNEFYVFGDTYCPDSRDGVYATEAGDQIIILRYYRKVEENINRTGSYKVVHEYYYRKAADNGQAEEEEDRSPEEGTESLAGLLTDGSFGEAGRLAGQAADTPEEENGEGEFHFAGTLAGDNEYSYTFEGMTDVEDIPAPLGTQVFAADIQKKTGFTPDGGVRHNYTYHNAGYGETSENGYYEFMPDKEWAGSTEAGNQIVILRYVRSDGEPEKPGEPDEPDKPDEPDNPDNPKNPEEPDDPVPGTEESPSESEKPSEPAAPSPEEPTEPARPGRPSGGGGGGERDRTPATDPAPELPTEPVAETSAVPSGPEEPSQPSAPPYPEGLPDPQDPNSPETITIWEDGVPRTYRKVWDPETESFIYLPEDEIPLSGKDLPRTGDRNSFLFWTVLLFAGGAGFILMTAARRREKRNRYNGF